MQAVEDTKFDQTAILELADDLKRAWTIHDTDEVDRLVEKLGFVRQQLILDWLPAMCAYHVPDWRPRNRKVAFRETDPKEPIHGWDVQRSRTGAFKT